MKVYIHQPNSQYVSMFKDAGHEVVEHLAPATYVSKAGANVDLIQFTGGEDVSPVLYGERNVASGNNLQRDFTEIKLFMDGLNNAIPMAGICRGAQFLNVMCGGRMWQDVDGHLGKHTVTDLDTRESFDVTSTHHQMMIPDMHRAETVLVATPSLSTCRTNPWGTYPCEGLQDIEALYYFDQKVFCFQPHPEFAGEGELAVRYFDYLQKYLGVE